MAYYSNDQVKLFLPHRDPFLFIDEIETMIFSNESELEQKEDIVLKDLIGCQVVANFLARPDLAIFQGHFPNYPILPGVVHIETMAQAGAFIVSKIFKNPFNMDLKFTLLSVSRCKFRKPIRPNMQLKVYTELKRVRNLMMTYEGRIEVDGQICSEATFLASMEVG